MGGSTNLKINKWSTRHLSALHHLFKPSYTTELTTFLPDIWGISASSFTPVYSGIFNRLSVLWKEQRNFTSLLLHVHHPTLCAPLQSVTALDFRANSTNAIIQSLQLLHNLLWEYSEPSAVSTSRPAVPGSMQISSGSKNTKSLFLNVGHNVALQVTAHSPIPNPVHVWMAIHKETKISFPKCCSWCGLASHSSHSPIPNTFHVHTSSWEPGAARF